MPYDGTVTFVQAIALALLQGVSELFPVSSLGQTILIPSLLRWHNINRSDPTFLAFVTVLHLGTAFALVIFYRKTWVKIVKAFVGSIIRGKIGNDPDERIAWLLVVGSIPVGLLGVLLKDPVRQFFGSPRPSRSTFRRRRVRNRAFRRAPSLARRLRRRLRRPLRERRNRRVRRRIRTQLRSIP